MAGYVYILTNSAKTVLYTGVTSKFSQRIHQHKNGDFGNSFTKRYHVHKLVYYEYFDSISDAIRREKQIKAGSRQKKIDLINKNNPTWKELSAEYAL
jgi:putative endonuclease